MNSNRSGLLNADLRAFTVVMEIISFAFQCSNYVIVYILEVKVRRKKVYTFLCSIKNSCQEDVILLGPFLLIIPADCFFFITGIYV